LWVNLPAKSKLTPPKYRGIARDQIPEVPVTADALVRVISGSMQGKVGPVRDLTMDCQFLDVTVKSNGRFEHQTPKDYRVCAYVLDGEGVFSSGGETVAKDHAVVYGSGDKVQVQAGNDGARFLLISGKPIGEPVAWRGSIVMNTQQELSQAYRELEEGTFLEHEKPGTA
jgi:quercetin 2,3-dioxygenase